MPIYEYQCRACGHAFERLTTRAQADAVACSRCGSPKAERVLSVFGVGAGAGSAALPCGSGSCQPGHSRSPCAGGSCPHLHH